MPSGNSRPYGLDLNVLSHAVKVHVCTSLNSMVEGEPRCAALTCLCTILFVCNAPAYTDQYPVSLLLHLKLIEAGGYVVVLLGNYGVSNKVALYCCMRRHSVCQHWLEWWRAVCSVPGHHPSLWWYTVKWNLDWILRFLNKQVTAICMLWNVACKWWTLCCGLNELLSCAPTSDYMCVITESHLHRNIVVWNCMLFNVDATSRRCSRRGDYQVDDGMPVVFNWTAIGAVPGALTVAAGAYPFKLIIYRVITTCLALYIYLIRHCAIHYVFEISC